MSFKTIVSSFADFILLEANILVIKFTFDGQLEVENAIEILKISTQYFDQKKHSLIYDFNQHNVIFSQEIKQIAQSRNEENAFLISRAFVSYNLSNKLEISHFIKYNKPSTPTEIFNSLNEALLWTKNKLAQT